MTHRKVLLIPVLMLPLVAADEGGHKHDKDKAHAYDHGHSHDHKKDKK